jgi:hypothetical protein
MEDNHREKVMPKSEGKKDIPKTVERYVEEHLEQGNDEGKAWALAWSRYCEYKNPGSPRCKQDSYFDGKKASSNELKNILSKLPEDQLLLLWNSMKKNIDPSLFKLFGQEFTRRKTDLSKNASAKRVVRKFLASQTDL